MTRDRPLRSRGSEHDVAAGKIAGIDVDVPPTTELVIAGHRRLRIALSQGGLISVGGNLSQAGAVDADLVDAVVGLPFFLERKDDFLCVEREVELAEQPIELGHKFHDLVA